MDLQELFISIQNNIATKEKRKNIPSQEMANRIHCSKSTYDKYLSGDISPKAVNNIMCLLSMLTEADLLRVVAQWRTEFECDKNITSEKDKK